MILVFSCSMHFFPPAWSLTLPYLTDQIEETSVPISILARRLTWRTKCDHIPGNNVCPNSRLQIGAKKTLDMHLWDFLWASASFGHPLGTDIYLPEIPSAIAAVLSFSWPQVLMGLWLKQVQFISLQRIPPYSNLMSWRVVVSQDSMAD